MNIFSDYQVEFVIFRHSRSSVSIQLISSMKSPPFSTRHHNQHIKSTVSIYFMLHCLIIKHITHKNESQWVRVLSRVLVRDIFVSPESPSVSAATNVTEDMDISVSHSSKEAEEMAIDGEFY